MKGNAVRLSGLLLLAGAALLLSACESLVRGTEQEVTIQTDPTGADVTLTDGQRCTSPCRLTVPRYHEVRARIAKPGCRTVLALLNPAVNDDGVPLGRVSDIQLELGPRLYRTVYDYQLGGAYDIDPSPLAVTLVCGAAATEPRAPGLTAADEALLAEFGRYTRDSRHDDPAPLR